MNESTLEARVHQVLENIFPTFRVANVEHQVSFSIKFGLHDVLIDNKKPGSHNRAIADVLLTIGDRPVILMELKAQNHAIAEDDVHQGLSYGRLIDKIPPITVITNSKDTRLYNTFTREKLEASEIDAAMINKMLDQGLRVAAGDLRDAIELLLGKDPTLFAEVAERITMENMNHLLGTVLDLTIPIAQDFQLPRQLVDMIFHQNGLGNPVVAVRGGAFCGKTNLLYQVFQQCKSKPGYYMLYWDCRDATFGVFQKLANEFSKILSYKVDADKVRGWLLSNNRRESSCRMLVCFDNLNFEGQHSLVAEVTELISLFDGTAHTVVYTVDDFNYDRIAYVADRPYKTALGSRGVLLDLEELNEDEFDSAQRVLVNGFGIAIIPGGIRSKEYRQPRILRQMTAELLRERRTGSGISIVNAIPDERQLEMIGTGELYSRNIRAYRNICLSILTDKLNRRWSGELSLISHGTGLVRSETYKRMFKNEFKTLVKSGLVAKRTYVGIDLVLPKVPELLAYCAVMEIYDRVSKKYNGKNFIEVADLLLQLSTSFPYSDIVGSLVIRKVGETNNWEFFSGIVTELMRRPPEVTRSAGAKVMLLWKKRGR